MSTVTSCTELRATRASRSSHGAVLCDLGDDGPPLAVLAEGQRLRVAGVGVPVPVRGLVEMADEGVP